MPNPLISASVDHQTRDRLIQLAVDNDQSLSSLIREILQDYLKEIYDEHEQSNLSPPSHFIA